MITELNRFLCENLVQYPSVCDHAYYYNSGIFQCGGGDRDDQNMSEDSAAGVRVTLWKKRHNRKFDRI